MAWLVRGTIGVVVSGAQAETAKLSELARLHLESGDVIRAADLCREALNLDRDCYEAHLVLASLALSGDDYLCMLERIQRHLRPRGYLEIGVGEGNSLALAGEGTRAIGVDPEPQVRRILPATVKVVRETSDSFFASRNAATEFDGNPPDLVFIDGLHLFEHALRDFINVERNSAPHTVVLLHDCYPLDEPTSARNQVTRFWSGDVWKLIVCLKKYRPDLAVHTLSALPTGLGLIRSLDRYSQVLSARFDDLCREFVPLPFAALLPDKRAALSLVPSEWSVVLKLLA